MKINIIESPKGKIAIVESKTPLITDVQSALDFIATMSYEHNAYKIAINKSSISEDFFKLSSGFAGEIIQKFVTYECRLAIIGDYSNYTSKPLQDYIYECNNGKHLNFVTDENEAIQRLDN